MTTKKVGVLGAGISGCCVALALANRGIHVDLLDRGEMPMTGASLHNEGKLHLGYVYAADPDSLTHEVMCLGSLTFAGILGHLTGTTAGLLTKSTPFQYAIPTDSRLPLENILNHFRAVDETVARHLHGTDEFVTKMPIRGSCLLQTGQYRNAFNTDHVQACIQTDEIALDPRQVAAIINDAVLKHPLIKFMPGCTVRDAERFADGSSGIRFHREKSLNSANYPVIVNCLWGDRLRIDLSAGIIPDREWLLRYKASITFDHPSVAKLANIPSVTFISGPYGDVVYHESGRVYVSWYPKCKLAETGTVDCLPLYEAAARADKLSVIRDSLSALSKYVPSVGTLLNFSNVARVGGGVIFAWGNTDITDPGSMLHQRHMIGPNVIGNWISLDTGKYCMAPHLAMQVSTLICNNML